MMDSEIYSVFFRKLAINKLVILPDNNPKYVTFLNPYTIELAKKDAKLYENFDYIGSDGILPVILTRFFIKSKISRISFDMTSFANDIFNYLNINSCPTYIIGSTDENISKFVKIVQSNFPRINIVGYHHGYLTEDMRDNMIFNILKINPKVVIIGMGAPLQDYLAIMLKERGFKGSVYTCGGFIHQTTNNIQYYPTIVDRMNLRFLYRVIKEPYVLKRILFYYPIFTVNYLKYLFINRRIISKFSD